MTTDEALTEQVALSIAAERGTVNAPRGGISWRAAEAALPIIRKAERDAAVDALDGLAKFAVECLHGMHGDLDVDNFNGWHHTWAAAIQHNVTHYPEEETP